MIVLFVKIGCRIAVRKSDIKAVMENDGFATVKLDDGGEITTINGFNEICDELIGKVARRRINAQ